ncbi:TPA: S8 family serine peptidase [Staphylococcus aureus]|nr:S8 family serine peptidase [Staphylococcus aureus]
MNKKIIIICFFSLFFFLNPSYIYASEKENITFILKDDFQGEKIYKDAKKIFSRDKVTYLKEVNILNINTNNNNGISYLKKQYKNEIIESATLLKVKDTTNKVSDNVKLQNKKFQKNNWYLNRITNNGDSLRINNGDKNIKIGVIDSGVDQDHPLLKKSVDYRNSKNYVIGENNIDSMGHGTMVAGVINAISPQTTIVSYKVMGKKDGESIWVIKAIIDAANSKNQILNLSLGTYKSEEKEDEHTTIQAYKRAINYARSKGVLVVGAMGNEGYNLNEHYKNNNELELPASINGVISVSSTMKNHQIAPYSNTGNMVSFSAPSGFFGNDYIKNRKVDITEMVVTTFPKGKEHNQFDRMANIPNGYTLSFGTSLSAPQVTASLANLQSEYRKSMRKEPSNDEIVNYLAKGSVDLGPKGKDNKYGYGEINLYKSLKILIKDSKKISIK